MAGAGAGVGWLWLALVGSLVFYSFRVGFSHGNFLIVLIVKIVFLSGSCGGVHPGVGWLGVNLEAYLGHGFWDPRHLD